MQKKMRYKRNIFNQMKYKTRKKLLREMKIKKKQNKKNKN